MDKLDYIKQNWISLLEMAIVFSIPAAGVGFVLSKHAKIGALEPIVVVIVFCAVCGVFNLPAVTVPVLILIVLAISLTAWSVVFLVNCFIALFSKRCMAKLVRLDVPEGMKSAVAIYKIDGREYQCAVGGLKKKLVEDSEISKRYVTGNEYKVKYSRMLNKVFDKRAVAINIACFFVGVFGAALFIMPLMIMDKLPS